VIVLTRRHHDLGGKGSVLLGILLALAVVGIAILVADRLARLLPASLIQFLTRVFGLLLSAIAVQLVVNGVRGTIT